MAGWHTRAIIYQIDTALFYDLNGDGCGDIAGIAAKLRYIRRMGATVIWITPFYLTPFLDEGYDVSDHLQVDPRFGKLNDIIAFIEQARELGMQVIIELLIQHTSDAHPGFNRPAATLIHPIVTITCGPTRTTTIRRRCSRRGEEYLDMGRRGGAILSAYVLSPRAGSQSGLPCGAEGG